ncbi:hypothetical protein SAMN05216480_102223 [Pustulibacterium marinum]|uniref:Permease n=1 Tax=Pustulibacterium marinum TaxID=1224947 RepID=A0A1I7FTH3_9FLAO|nr:permease [Pustulibacterium marinum]SFU39512.1 hypothetical protein SAMN05216480_102223 [Pustulibacterium marinum]
MDISLQKTLVFLAFILIGYVLKAKFSSKEELTGIKTIILNLALPATIFLALIDIQIKTELLLLPVVALAFNAFLFFIFPWVLPLLGIQKGTPKYRTAKLLIPSLAPGLSCFAFISEFLGDQYLAKAAMTDLGNKIFVLFILYSVAMNWHVKLTKSNHEEASGSKLKSLAIRMISEPVNIFIFVALLLVSFNIHSASFPFVLQSILEKLKYIMTPLVLLYIGLAVNVQKKQFAQITALLLLRAGVTLVVLSLVFYVIPLKVPQDILVLTAFCLSSCSFWPFAHIASVSKKELENDQTETTFLPTYGINILALSLPISTLLILGILAAGNTFANPNYLLILGIFLTVCGLIPVGVYQLQKRKGFTKESFQLSLKKNTK